MDYQEEVDALRKLFKQKFPDVQKITQANIHKLIYLVDEEMEKHAESGNLRMYMEPLNRYVANMIRQKGIGYKGLELHVLAHYFHGREAITFTKDGRVFFCGWAGGNNHRPFLDGFKKWLQAKEVE